MAVFAIGALIQMVQASTPTCLGESATEAGTSGDDVLLGTPDRDVIVGFAGDDTIHSLGGNDLVCGGQGADVIEAGGGADGVSGGPGNDTLFGEGIDQDPATCDLLCGDGLNGNGGDDTIAGGPYEDFLNGGRGNDSLMGGKSTDLLEGRWGKDEIDGGEGSDTARYIWSPRAITADLSNGVIKGWGEDQVIGVEMVQATRFSDVLYGSHRGESLSGGAQFESGEYTDQGNDVIVGRGGRDSLFGEGGSDRIKGGSGNDFLNGDLTDDMRGENDVLRGGRGKDRCVFGEKTSGCE